jgi:SOS-response transcriptional repressor LexA
MGTIMSERLREARKRAGYETAEAACQAFGWKPAGYRHHEAGLRKFDPEAAKRYARAFKVSAAWLMGMEAHLIPAANSLAVALEVTGEVAAGVWQTAREWPPEKRFTIVVPGDHIPKVRRFGLRVIGRSMDLLFPEGTVLDCISIFDVESPPENGDLVIVEKTGPDGYELTVKEYYIDQENVRWLVPRSTQPEFQAPTRIGKPDESLPETDGTVQIIAYVIGSYSQRNPRFFRQ